jgi:hypothetical protein
MEAPDPMIIKRLLAASLALIPGIASAASCGARDSVIANLKDKYAEELRVGGLQNVRGSHSVMEIWVNDETKTFTVLLTQANGISCIVAAGTDFFEAAPISSPAGKPT